jgi:Fe-S cluster biosynthesis and repair protein YggX
MTSSQMISSTLMVGQNNGPILTPNGENTVNCCSVAVEEIPRYASSTLPAKELRRKISVDDNDDGQPSRCIKRLKKSTDSHESTAPLQSQETLILLAQKEDKTHINALHIFIREQIEVFCATATEIEQPAPGRKVPIQLSQVGLRCIHCRCLPSNKRAKRAICYPSSVGRVYNSVSDMKFDHFPNCKLMPEPLRDIFVQLKGENKTKPPSKPGKAPGTYFSTSQYYHDSAQRMGLVTLKGGVFFQSEVNERSAPDAVPAVENDNDFVGTKASQSMFLRLMRPSFDDSSSAQKTLAKTLNILRLRQALHGIPAIDFGASAENTQKSPSSDDVRDMPYRLHTLKDSEHLSPIHCFVRRHVEFFVANKDDLTVPSPGRKTPVILGQVGIRCVHCAKLPVRERVKRSVCYPASVSGIYHSVSNMKFDHFLNCKGLPVNEKTEFVRLRNSCQRGRKDSSNSDVDQQLKKPGNSNSTAQFYHDSAMQLGLIDTDNGIRFGKTESHDNVSPKEDVSVPSVPSSSFNAYSSANDGLSALMIAAMVRLQSSPMKC